MKDIILREVAKEFCITEEEMFSRKRTRNIAYARQCAAFILKGIGFEYKEIAKILNKDRATIYYYVKVFGYDLEKDTSNKQRYNNALQTMKILSFSEELEKISKDYPDNSTQNAFIDGAMWAVEKLKSKTYALQI